MIARNIIALISSFLFFLTFVFESNAQNKGVIAGFIKNARNLFPLQGVSVTIPGTDFGTTTDSSGYYQLRDLPLKTYTLEASLSGFRSGKVYDLVLTSGNSLEINFDLEPEYKALSDVDIKSSFVRPSGSVNSVQSLGITEITRYPGANFDMAKVVQSLPGVSGSVGFRNDIIIRGGAPNENSYFIDAIEVPSINHFATQGAAGGPVGMLNVSFIENVTLHTSAFPARYDNPLSGVLQFKQRTGNASKLQGNVRLSATEAALTFEGPLGKKNGKTTFIASARRSYLQFVFKLIDLPFLPDYWDYQYKITHRPDQKNEINFLGLGAIDNFRFNQPENPTLEQQSILDQIPLNTQRTNTTGVSWRHSIPKGYWVLALSNNRLKNTADKYEGNDETDESKRILNYTSVEDETRLRFEINRSYGNWQLSAGTVTIYTQYSSSTYSRRPGYVASYKTDVDLVRYGGFFQAGRRLLDNRLQISLGVRADGNTFTEDGSNLLSTFSPRFSASYRLAPGLNANVSLGRYFKLPPYTILGFKTNDVYINKSSRYIRSDHLVGGLEWNPDPSTRITGEGFYKKYADYPISIYKGISLANLGGDFGVLGNEPVSDDGEGRAYGFEFMYQKRLTKNFYGILAYTYYNSQFTGTDGQYRPSAWDYRHLVSFTGGCKLPRNWEIGVRFRYQGSAPATPYDVFESLENYPFTNQPVLDYSRVNTDRLRAFNAADLRIDKVWNFKKWSLDLFLDVQNFYNSTNPIQPDLTLKRNTDNSIATTTGDAYNPGIFGNPSAPNNRQDAIPVILPNDSGSRLPSLGFIIEFL